MKFFTSFLMLLFVVSVVVTDFPNYFVKFVKADCCCDEEGLVGCCGQDEPCDTCFPGNPGLWECNDVALVPARRAFVTKSSSSSSNKMGLQPQMDTSFMTGNVASAHHVVWAWSSPPGSTCSGSACGVTNLSWDASVSKYLARNNHPSKSVKVTLPGFGGMSNSAVLQPSQQTYMIQTYFVNPWHADFV